MTANWSPHAQEARNQRCFGVWSVLGTTGGWPQVVNMWEEAGWSGLASSFAGEAVGPGAQDPVLERWWARAADFRRGGFDRLMVPRPWSRSIQQLCADGVSGACYAHDLIRVRPGEAEAVADEVAGELAEAHAWFGWELAGGFTTALVNDDELLLLWAVPTWSSWAEAEAASDPALVAWRDRNRDRITARHRMLLVDAPLSPMRIGRQPHRDDRTDWTD